MARNGTYAQCVRTKHSGNAGARITIRAENDGGATLSFSSHPTCATGVAANVVDFASQSYNTLRGFKVMNHPGFSKGLFS